MLSDVSASLNNVRSKPNRKIKVWVYSIKKNMLTFLFCAFTILLALFSRSNLASAKDGLKLWATAVVPSLFPFFVATEMLSNTNVVYYLGRLLNPIMRPLFGIPGEGAFAFIIGLISGYPVGAKIVSDFTKQGITTKEEAERMLAFTNNSGPLFIIGTVGITLFRNSSLGILLFITHVLACISVGIVLNLFAHNKITLTRIHGYFVKRKKTKRLTLLNRRKKLYTNINNINNLSKSNSVKYKLENSFNSTPTFSSLGEILGNSIKNATSTILMIGGFVVIFSVIISILNQSHILMVFSNVLSPFFQAIGYPTKLVEPLLSGIVELTNGVNLVSMVNIKNISISIATSAFLLGFGGFSVLLQVYSIVSKNGLSIKKYAIGKFLQGIFAYIYTLIALNIFPFLQFNL